MSNNNNGVLSGITAGLKNTYAYLASQYPNGLTLENINEAKSKNTNANLLNQTFASYLQNNFKTIDKNGDGKITEQEMNNLSNLISTQGLTKEQLIQLYASGSSGISQSTMNKILEHFDDMDANHDGKITSAEISAYDIKCARMETEDNFNNRKASDMSVFYGDSSSSSDTYNLLSYKYKSNKST
jgi:Ca2+-binding EF-hand superfamily protein